MTRGEWLTKGTIWLALCLYGVGAAGLIAVGHPSRLVRTRWAWTLACAFFLAHVICAFTYYHGWSHAAAYRETERQTAALTGWRSGGGLYLNYLVAIAWLADVLWWWLAPESFARRSPRLGAIWQGFLFFMVFNATVVFGKGPVRWFGLLLCGTLAGLWWRRYRVAGTAAGK